MLNNIEIITNICLVCINITGECMQCISEIENALYDNDIQVLFLSSSNIFTKCEKIYLSVYENDIFKLMNILGNLSSEARIRNYSINCSNSMIHWFGKKKNVVNLLKKAKNDIKFLTILSDEGICFCDNAYKKRICSLLS